MNLKKNLSITGSSNVSWKDAIVKTIEEASKTITKLSEVRIIEQRAQISGDKLTTYVVELELSFDIDITTNSSTNAVNSN